LLEYVCAFEYAMKQDEQTDSTFTRCSNSNLQLYLP